jgi:hypothetical protein
MQAWGYLGGDWGEMLESRELHFSMRCVIENTCLAPKEWIWRIPPDDCESANLGY